MDGRNKTNLSGVRQRPTANQSGVKPYRIAVKQQAEFRRCVFRGKQFVSETETNES